MNYKKPKTIKITGRSSSITNAFVNGILPYIKPTEKELDIVFKKLKMNKNKPKCVYCGDKATQWDHLHPIVNDKYPTGYITEIYNLIPCCSTCNSSKSGSNWKHWMEGKDKNGEIKEKNSPSSPLGRGVNKISEKIKIIEEYDNWCKDKRFIIKDFENIVDKDKWDEHWDNHKNILKLMKDVQPNSDKIKIKLQDYIDEKVKERKLSSQEKKLSL